MTVIDELRQIYPLKQLLTYLGVARATFYYHLKQLAKADKHQAIKHEIQQIHHTHKGRYGYRRMTLALKQLGFIINHKTVQRLMHELGLQAVIRRKRSKYSTYRGQVGKIADHVLNRDFKADKPNHKWATDVTEFKVLDKQGNVKKLYLSPIMDLFNGEIVSYQMHSSPNYGLVAKMLDQALKRLQADDNAGNDSSKPQLILHSDQGWHYQMQNYQQTLKDNNIIQSMSRKGNCLDNAVIESFFGTLKEEIFFHDKHQRRFTSIDELKQAIDEYIHYYNHDRIKIKLKGLSPVKYRRLVLDQTT
ncbi:IS3 family transposase [Moraxella sp. FZLJ2107]|uniref:IS3 family transposase n=1 Tax=unclassified Moraxella TaxID=2685852 RepID=UPI0020C89F16|nr:MULTISPECIES: IS3 family transposase [unclassified Moraxella]UTO06126.1 IS3 family transposase [Moraxella sp. FZLJ2107]UTO23513.1 IS3 family transposase [Moraxella sp. FZLJ2109]